MEVASRRCPMIRTLILAVAMVALTGTPALARGGGGVHGGGGFHGGGFHGGGSHGGEFRGGHEHFGGFGRFHHFGGFFFPYAYYPYPGYTYAYPYPVYSPPTVVEQPPAAYEQPPIQREVVYPNGKYVLEGDGVTQAYQWVWIPAIPAVAPAIQPG
jgi:hypothetical protein